MNFNFNQVFSNFIIVSLILFATYSIFHLFCQFLAISSLSNCLSVPGCHYGIRAKCLRKYIHC